MQLNWSLALLTDCLFFFFPDWKQIQRVGKSFHVPESENGDWKTVTKVGSLVTELMLAYF